MIVKKCISLVFLIGLVAGPVLAQEAPVLDSVFNGRYSRFSFCAQNPNSCERDTKFNIRTRSNVLVMTDTKNDIDYKADFRTTEDHNSSPDYLAYLIKRSSAVDGFLDELSVSNHRVTKNGKGFELDFNFNFKFDSVFIDDLMDGRFALRLEAEYVESCTDRNEGDDLHPDGCIAIKSKGIRITSMETGLGMQANKIVGLTLDFTFRIFSMFTGTSFIPQNLYKLK